GRDTFLALEVKRDAALVPVQVLEIRAEARPAHVALFDVFRGFYLDDIRAPVGELAHAGWAGTDPRQIEYGETRQGLGSRARRHVLRPRTECPDAKDARHSPISLSLSTGAEAGRGRLTRGFRRLHHGLLLAPALDRRRDVHGLAIFRDSAPRDVDAC